jgi:hypothetical protein
MGRATKSWEALLRARGLIPPKSANKALRPGDKRKGIATVKRYEASHTAPMPALQVLDVEVVAQPRQNRADAWRKRPCVLRYRACRDALRAAGLRLPERYALVIYLPMPVSWPKSRRDAMNGSPHQNDPDKTNLEKSVEDSACSRDERLYDGRAVKVWAGAARLVVVDVSQRETPSDEDIAAWLPR